MAEEKSKLPATFEEFEKQAKDKVMAKIKAGQPLDNKDTMILNGYIEMYDPALQARKQVTLKDYYEYVKSLEENQL